MTQYLASFNNEVLGLYEHFDVVDGQLVSYLNPAHGKVFASVDEVKTWVGKYVTNLPIEAMLLEDANKAFARISHRRPYRKTAIKSALSRRYANESREEVLAWHWAKASKEESVSYEDYATWPRLYTLFEHIWEVSGYYIDSKREKVGHTFTLRVKPDADLDNFKKEFAKLPDNIGYLDEDGGKIFPIFDHYLCEGGNSASFIVCKDGSYRIDGRWQTYIKGDLTTVFNWWKANRSYPAPNDTEY